jgi:hypothetical protein
MMRPFDCLFIYIYLLALRQFLLSKHSAWILIKKHKIYYLILINAFCQEIILFAWQKGEVENMNKLLRQYLPIKTNLENINEKQIYEIQKLLNNHPRKGLNYHTPNEKLCEFKQSGALNSRIYVRYKLNC